jgi:hypothetical protein
MLEVLRLLLTLAVTILSMSFESAITIILTALAVMLAALAIGIGVVAVWGYIGLRDSVKAAAEEHVAKTMREKLKDYPEAAEFIRLKTEIQQQLALASQLTSPATEKVAPASNNEVQEQPQIAEVAPKYPGEEEPDASAE